MNKKTLIAGVALAFISSCSNMENPLLMESSAPYGAPQFDKIRNEHYMPAFEVAIAEAKAEIDAIVANPQEPDFENTIEAMEQPARLSVGWQAYSIISWKQTLTTRCSRLQRRSHRCLLSIRCMFL